MSKTKTSLRFPALLLAACLVVIVILGVKLRRHQVPHVIFSSNEEVRSAVTALGGSPSTPPVIVLRAEWCPACKALEASLREAKVTFLEADVDTDPTAQMIQRKMWDNGIDTIPQVIVGDRRLPLASVEAVRSSLSAYLSQSKS